MTDRNRLVVEKHEITPEPATQLGIQQRRIAWAVVTPVIDEHPAARHAPD
jgi:hypothetical protein